jgi:PAS domain S-box-containing protein
MHLSYASLIQMIHQGRRIFYAMKPENQNTLPIAPAESDSTQQPPLPSPSNNHTGPSRKSLNSFWMIIQDRLASSTSPLPSLPASLRRWYIGYLIAVILQVLVVSLIALIIRLYAPFSFVEAPALLAVVFLSLGWGIGPGIVATLTGAIFFDALVFPPYLSFRIHRTEDITGIFLYLLISLAICLMARQTQRAQQQTQSAKSETTTLQHQLHELFMQAPTPITVLRGPDHRLELVNPLTQQAVGNRQILGLPLREAIPEYIEQGIIDRLDWVYTTGEPLTIPELRAETRQRTNGLSTPVERYFTVVYQPTRTPQGEVDGIVIFNVEVTEQVHARKQMEQLVQELDQERARLRQAEQIAAERANQLETVFEAMTDGVFILDPRNPQPQLNTAARELLEITADDTIDSKKKPSFDLLDEQGQPLPRELWPETRLRNGERLLSKDAVDVVFRAHTGRIRALSITGAPFLSPDQKVTGGVLVCRDVTERRQLEQQTQESLQSLLILAEALVSLPTTDEEISNTEIPIAPIELVAKRLVVLIRSVLGCKRVSLTAYDPQTQTLRSVAVAGLPPDQEQSWKGRHPGFRLSDLITEDTLQTQFQAGNPVVIDMTKPPFDRQPNTYGIKKMLLVPMLIENRLVGILSLDHAGEDWQFHENEKLLAKAVAELAALIIERERLLEERTEAQASVLALQETNLLKDEFIGIAGHELRTPLTTIKASVQLARRQVTRLSKQEQALSPDGTKLIASLQTLLDRAERQVGMQNRLVNDLLDISRIETGKLELHPALHDLVTLVREVLEDQRALTPERQILFKSADYGEVLVLVDADRLRQVVTNYLTNALKYSEAEKPVTVCIVLLASRARVEIEDQGPGITLTQQQHIWERFYRVPGIEVRSGSGVGLGLGLHISRMIIERQSGQVGVRSVPGEGSTFWFSLPLAE